MARSGKYVCYSQAHGGQAAYLIPSGDDYEWSKCSCWSHCHHGYVQVSRKRYLEY